MGEKTLTSDGDGGVVGAEDVELQVAEFLPERRRYEALDGLYFERPRPRPYLRFRRHLPSPFFAGDRFCRLILLFFTS
jgi:hypothetical protein